ncbi:MAG: L-histidine N(alpha)-methyltransferase [Bacteroidia bacterium]
MIEHFIKEVDEGLSIYPKRISSKFLYDSRGGELFQQIMELPEYYLTRAEEEIFKYRSHEIIDQLGLLSQVNIYELGAGDGTKTSIFLKALRSRGIMVNYIPIDVSKNVLEQLENHINVEVKGVKVKPLQYTYFQALDKLEIEDETPNIFLFMGSNLGNLDHATAIKFLSGISENMRSQDHFLLGLDKMKEPEKVLAAYNDQAGVTKEFNLNLLERMNRELGANFEMDNFIHQPIYNPETGLASSYLVSTVEQDVFIEATGKTYHFDAWESLHTEISQKYNMQTIEWLCESSSLRIKNVYQDNEEQFLECLLEKKD